MNSPPEAIAYVKPIESAAAKTSSALFHSVMENSASNRYSFGMTAIERNILDSLNELDAAVKTMATANPKPNLLLLFARIESLANELPRGTAPDLLHYMQRKSYEKARLWLQGHFDEIQKGGCSR